MLSSLVYSMPHDPHKRKNPPRGACGEGSSSSRSQRGRSSGRGASGHGDADDISLRPPTSNIGIPCPPLTHADRMAGATASEDISPKEHEIRVHGRAIDPRVVARTPELIGVLPTHRLLRQHQHYNPSVHPPSTRGSYTPRRAIDYRRRAVDLRNQRTENPYQFQKDPSLEDRFWSQFQSDYYWSVIYLLGEQGTSPPIFPHKAINLSSLQNQTIEIDQLVKDLKEVKLLDFMAFQLNWNT